ncbi:L7Ae/L30e/S12e/Gadd45 family ribosomal protein [Limosilactobacillus caccae]|jgi:ribosomal protein L7Ae-like RNA K-turn-binding protein|uniref:L7Ae/L30e/S12e/Gadd45 family ribosomal protein n=1 Tax=Limosilactobacillus caccae TaxID=1926284 RepID=UPI0009712A4B|nr:ribosomal L7Ae/L30e/S12e/Gadd45 family protein [Limosilactobacillus caccae]
MIKNNQQVLNLLGLARRARQLQSGEGIVIKNIQTQQAKFVFLAADAGKASAKKITDKCKFYGIPFSTAYTKDQLSQATGQSRTVFCVMQSGFARKFEELLTMD